MSVSDKAFMSVSDQADVSLQWVSDGACQSPMGLQ